MKFRAWDRANHKMVYFELQTLLSSYFAESIIYNSDFYLWHKCNETYEPIMQCTGKDDENGKEVYEGDIIEPEGGGYIFIVRRGIERIDDNEGYGDNLISGFYLEDAEQNNHLRHIDMLDGCKILGNVYETPKLLSLIKLAKLSEVKNEHE